MRIRQAFLRIAMVAVLIPPATMTLGATSEQTLDLAGYEQKLGSTLPRDLAFLDAEGRSLTLAELANDKPLVLIMSWFECPNLCPMLLDQLARAMGRLSFDSRNYSVAIVSIDPKETPEDAAATRQRLTKSYGQGPGQWRYLTSEAETIDRLATAVGFQYAYDAEDDRFAHPAGYVILAPGATVNSYLFSLRPGSADLELALLDASRGELGTALDRVVLRCYRFSPDTGQYNLAVMRVIQAAGGTFLMAGILVFWWMRRRQRGG